MRAIIAVGDWGNIGVKRSIRIRSFVGSQQYEFSFEDDDTATELEFELSTTTPPLRSKTYRASRAALIRKATTGHDVGIDALIREFLSSS